MLTLKVQRGEEIVELKFEHSLLSLSKWEARTKKAFLTDRQKTPGELMDYFADMLTCLSPDADPADLFLLKPDQMEKLVEYMNDSQTASSVPQDGKAKHNPETWTNELIYYYLSQMKIPFHPTETWHVNRIMMLIQIAGYKSQPPKKRSATEVMSDWYAANKRNKEILGIKD